MSFLCLEKAQWRWAATLFLSGNSYSLEKCLQWVYEFDIGNYPSRITAQIKRKLFLLKAQVLREAEKWPHFPLQTSVFWSSFYDVIWNCPTSEKSNHALGLPVFSGRVWWEVTQEQNCEVCKHRLCHLLTCQDRGIPGRKWGWEDGSVEFAAQTQGFKGHSTHKDMCGRASL